MQNYDPQQDVISAAPEPQRPVPGTAKAFSIVAFVCGICSLVTLFVGIQFGIAGLVFASLSRRRAGFDLVLRINALLRRAQMVADRRQTLGTTTFEFDSFSVLTGGVQTVLPQKEFLLLYKLVSSPGHIFTRQQLMDDIWGYDSSTDTHTVDVHIARLRERFRDNPDFKIVTMRGVGYKVVRT